MEVKRVRLDCVCRVAFLACSICRMSIEVQPKYDRSFADEGAELVQRGNPSISQALKPGAAPKYTDDDDLLPVVLERYLEKAGVM